MKDKHQVLIAFNNETHIPSGLLTSENMSPITFDPTTILPDIINKEFDLGYMLQIPKKEIDQFNHVISGIKNIITISYNQQSTIDLTLLELLRPYYEITYIFSPLSNVENQICELYYGSFDFEDVIQRKEEMYQGYFYKCFSISDIIFSILHFLAINNYKYSRCAHCERFFATTTYKEQYCPRLSTYPNREQLQCAKAVKIIRNDLQRIHRQIYQRYYAFEDAQVLFDFDNSYSELIADVKTASNYASINKCYDYLQNEKDKIKAQKALKKNAAKH